MEYGRVEETYRLVGRYQDHFWFVNRGRLVSRGRLVDLIGDLHLKTIKENGVLVSRGILVAVLDYLPDYYRYRLLEGRHLKNRGRLVIEVNFSKDLRNFEVIVSTDDKNYTLDELNELATSIPRFRQLAWLFWT